MSGYINRSGTNRVYGLASGIDTEGTVKKMLSTSTARIDKVNQQKQLLKWKQEDYRSVICNMLSFKDKYFNRLSSNNSLSSSFYSSKLATSANADDLKYINITASASTNVGSINIENIQVATQSVAKSQNAVSNQIMMGFNLGMAPIDLTGKSFDININGVTKSITLTKSYDTSAQLAQDIKSLTDAAFGTDRLSVQAVGDNIVINSDGTKVTLVPSSENNAFDASGLSLINDKTNRVEINKSIAENSFATPLQGDTYDFSINGKNFSFTKDSTIASIINTINTSDAGAKISYSSITDKFTLTSTATGSESAITLEDKTGNFLSSAIGALESSNYTQGNDASVYINGNKVTRPTNTFSIDGITYQLKANSSKQIDFNITNNTDKAFENIKGFVEDYNKLLDSLNSKMSETKYRDFAPLTDEQRAELSESDVTKWEEKARSGLLKNDPTLQKVITSLRQSMYASIGELSDNNERIGISLSSIGITTGDYKSKGKLVIDEQKLKEALANKGDEVINLFTQQSDKIYLPTNTAEDRAERYKESGIMNRISDILEDSARKTGGGGSLLQIAGYEGSTTENQNTINKSLKTYEDKLTKLLDSLAREENRYFAQFAAMEKYISEMNQKSAWMSSNMGG